MGGRGTYHSYGSGWANACNTPFRLYKHYATGGRRHSLHRPLARRHQRQGRVAAQVGHLIDMMADRRRGGRGQIPGEARRGTA